MAAARSHAGGRGGEKADWLTPIRNGLDWLEAPGRNTWSNSTAKRQRDAIYQPIADAARGAVANVTSAQRWRAMFRLRVAVALYLDHLGREARWMLLGVIGVVLTAFLAGVGWLLVRLGRGCCGSLDGQPRPAPRRPPGRNRVLQAFRESDGPAGAGSRPRPNAARVRGRRRGSLRLADGRQPAGDPARRGRRRLLPRPFRPDAPGQSPDPGGRTSIGGNRGDSQEHESLRKPRPLVAGA